MKKQINNILVEMTPEEIAEREAMRVEVESLPGFRMHQIADLKAQLAATDYKAIKYAEGWLTEADYGPVRAQRQFLRDRINELEMK